MKKVLALALAIVLIMAVCPAASAYEITSFNVTAKNAMIVSLDTGEVLYQKNASERIYPASITKLMTAAVILDKFPNPQDTDVVMTDSAYKRILGTGSAVLGAKVGEVINGKDALACVLISSAGDVVYAYAEAACRGQKQPGRDVFAYSHPDLVRQYEKTHPCRGCPLETGCASPCGRYLHWYDLRMELARKRGRILS